MYTAQFAVVTLPLDPICISRCRRLLSSHHTPSARSRKDEEPRSVGLQKRLKTISRAPPGSTVSSVITDVSVITLVIVSTTATRQLGTAQYSKDQPFRCSVYQAPNYKRQRDSRHLSDCSDTFPTHAMPTVISILPWLPLGCCPAYAARLSTARCSVFTKECDPSTFPSSYTAS